MIADPAAYEAALTSALASGAFWEFERDDGDLTPFPWDPPPEYPYDWYDEHPYNCGICECCPCREPGCEVCAPGIQRQPDTGWFGFHAPMVGGASPGRAVVRERWAA